MSRFLRSGTLCLLPLLLAGCGARWEVMDEDGDGYSAIDGDCDDTDRDVSPEAPELCDGIDNDCSGRVDDLPDRSKVKGALSLYADADGDGHGDPGAFVGKICPGGTDRIGTAPNIDDCDDNDERVYSGATESCDGIDNDCDQAIDEDCDSGL